MKVTLANFKLHIHVLMNLILALLVGCGDNHTVLVLDDGKLYSFGSNDFGQLGHSRPRTRPGENFSLFRHKLKYYLLAANFLVLRTS